MWENEPNFDSSIFKQREEKGGDEETIPTELQTVRPGAAVVCVCVKKRRFKHRLPRLVILAANEWYIRVQQQCDNSAAPRPSAPRHDC